MLERTFKITSELGLHARPATELVKVANEFKCDISLVYDDITVDFKSIMGVMSLAAYKDSKIKVICDGVDEEEAMRLLTSEFMDMKLGKGL